MMLFGRETIYWCSDRGKASDSGGGLAGCLLVTHFPLEAPFRSRWGGGGSAILPSQIENACPLLIAVSFLHSAGSRD